MQRGLKREDFEFFRQALKRLCGVSLQESKVRLVEARLLQRLEHHEIGSFAEYRQWLSRNENKEEWQVVIGKLTTHTTQWFREGSHFDHLKHEMIPGWKATTRTGHLRVWSAACSTGEEAYTLAMVLDAALGPEHSFEILGTDIDPAVLAKAKNGVYSADGASAIPIDYHSRAIAMGRGRVQGWMKMKQVLRSRVSFKTLNLAKPPYRFAHPFDVIFCRNVLIYFDQATVIHVARGLFDAAASNATLYTGHTESLANLDTPWSYRFPSIYTKGKGWGGGG